MRRDLAVDKLEAALSVGDLFAKAGSKLGEQIAMFERCGFGIDVQLSNFTRQQRVLLGIESSNVTLRVLDLASDAKKLRRCAFSSKGSVELAMIVEKALQCLDVAAFVGLIGAGHQQRKVLLLNGVTCKVGMDALGDIPKDRLEIRKRLKLFSFVVNGKCSIMAFLRAPAGFLGAAACGVGVIQIHLALDNACFDLIELGIKNADLAKVTAFEGL